MISFIDLTKEFDTKYGRPACAFVSTETDRFVRTRKGGRVFTDTSEVLEHIGKSDLLPLIPEGFFAS